MAHCYPKRTPIEMDWCATAPLEAGQINVGRRLCHPCKWPWGFGVAIEDFVSCRNAVRSQAHCQDLNTGSAESSDSQCVVGTTE